MLLGYGQENGLERVWLSVSNTNHVARALYESVASRRSPKSAWKWRWNGRSDREIHEQPHTAISSGYAKAELWIPLASRDADLHGV